MAESDVEHALWYRNRAVHIRITAQVLDRDAHAAALKRAAGYDLLADDIERAIKSRTKGEGARSNFGRRSYLPQKPPADVRTRSIIPAKVRLVRFFFRRTPRV